ncbi:glycosyltransferase family 2 protein [Aeromonas caviae]|uniref:glycosyltransferase family 2 protein n=1 Tax=Aeromonas caviae TaxID=648 RepID=UPI000A52D2E0|nr:glycosyltransferase family 2 protein [Aeromonas caviae]
MMESNPEVVSIIMPLYNSSKYIEESILSVINQSFVFWCLYIVDDCSTDNSLSLVQSLAEKDSRIKIINNSKNVGVAEARNIGIKMAMGKYIAFLDSDDQWSVNKLQSQVKVLESGYDVVCSNYSTFSESIGFTSSIRTFPREFTYTDMLTGNKIGNLTGVYNQERIGKVFQRQVGHEDYIMWLDVMSRTSKCFCVQDNLAYYRVSEKSLSGNKFKASLWQWNVYRKHLGLGVFKSAYYWHCYVFNALVR